MNERRSGAQGHGRASSGPPVVYGDAGVTGSGAADGSTPPPGSLPDTPGPTPKGTKVTGQTPHSQTRPFIPKLGTLGALAGFGNTYSGGPLFSTWSRRGGSMVETRYGRQWVRRSLGWREGSCSCHGLFRKSSRRISH